MEEQFQPSANLAAGDSSLWLCFGGPEPIRAMLRCLCNPVDHMFMQNVQSTVFEASITPGSDNIKHPGFKRMEGVAETLPVRTTLLALQTDFKIRGMLCLRASELGHPTTSSKAGDRLSANDRLTQALAFLFVGIHCDGSPVVRAGLRYNDIWRLIQPLLESGHATDFVRAVQRGVYEHWRVYAPSGGWGRLVW